MTRAFTHAAIAIVSLYASSDAIADSKAAIKAKAKQLYDEGLRYYNVAEYSEAIRVWKEAYLLSKRPLLLFNIGQAYRLSGDCKQAMTFYNSYRREDAKLDNQEDLVAAEAICKAKLAEEPATPPPPPPPVVTQPATPSPAPTPIAPPPEGGSPGMRKAGIVVGLAGVVLGAGAVYFALDAGKKGDELDDYRGEWDATQVQLDADGKRSEKLAWGFGAGALAAIGAGVALYVIGGGSSESRGVAVVPTRRGGQIAWTLTF